MLLNRALLLAVWVGGGGGGGGGGGAKDTYHRNKRAFQTSYFIKVLIKILFEFTGFFNLQNVVKQLLRAFKRGGLILCPGGL